MPDMPAIRQLMRKGRLPAADKVPICTRAGAKAGVQQRRNLCRFDNPHILRQDRIKRRNKALRRNTRNIGKKMCRLAAGMHARVGSSRTEKLNRMLMKNRQRPLDFALDRTEDLFSLMKLLLPAVKAGSVV